MGWTTFLFAYLVGGVTFLPLAVAVLLAHAYFTLPSREDVGHEPSPAADDIVQPGDDVAALKAVQRSETKSKPTHHDQDVAAGYFAVCREYTPMGINAKPIERTTPVGSATVASPSPSVYQTMYRSLFERKSTPSPLENYSVGNQRVRKAGNVFYVALRHGHLMLFDDDEQLEVRHVVSLTHHDVSIYSGEPTIPEGELFIKRNAICLSRRADGAEPGPDGQQSKPFYLFSENCSAKEDFYFALLRNQEQMFATAKKGPRPIQFDVKNIISLVQKLHSSEEHMQTRWLNAMIGRIFLGVHKTKDVENFIREKLTKKIARVKRPSFLSNIEIRGIDTGESAPYITNPRLKDLTVEGEWGMEADMRYTGNFRLEVATTARIDLGARFKVREVNLVLAVVVRKLEGHMLFKIKPPPSNRLWVSFQQPPKIEMTIEPIVSSRQITYTVILRQIESRIKEVIAETMVLPFWDDTPFFNTEHKKWRGGIFQDDLVQSSDLETLLAREGHLNQVEQMEDNNGVAESELPSVEKSHTMPAIDKAEHRPSSGLFGRRMSNKSRSDSNPSPSASSTSLDVRVDMEETPELKPVSDNEPFARSVPSATAIPPPAAVVGADAINAELFKPSASPPNEGAAAAMATLSARSRNSSSAAQTPVQPPVPSPFRPYTTSKSSHSSGSSHEATDSEKDAETTPQARRNTASSTESHDESGAKLPAPSVHGSIKSQTGSIARGLFSRRDTTPAPPSPVGSDMQKRNTLAAVSNAAASAKQWGLSALQRHALNKVGVVKDAPSSPTSEAPLDLKQPMGRGRPLPPPGTPLPMPDRKTKTAPIPVPKRKVVPPPALEHREEAAEHQPEHERRQPVAPPPLPKRWQRQNDQGRDEENVLVVAAPVDSEPASPLSGSHTPSYVQPWIEDVEDTSGGADTPASEGGASVETGNGHNAEKSHASRGVTTNSSPPADDDDYSAWMDDPEPDEAGTSTAAGPRTT